MKTLRPRAAVFGLAWLSLTVLSLVASLSAAESNSARLAKELRPLLETWSGKQPAFSLAADARLPIDGQPQSVELRLDRFDDASFDLKVTHPDYAVQIVRRADMTAMVLPKHSVVFLGRGELASGDAEKADQLAPAGIVGRLIGPESLVSVYAALATQSDPSATALLLTSALGVKFDEANGSWQAGDVQFRLLSPEAANGNGNGNGKAYLSLTAGETTVKLVSSKIESPAAGPADQWPGMNVVELDRAELERTLARGVRRSLEIFAPSPILTVPTQEARKVEHGELRWIEGQRVAILRGTPEQIGKAHGELLRTESYRCIDSVLHAFGTAQTIRTGRWFRSELDQAYARLAPHIPADHQREAAAMADALELDRKLVAAVNVFPELFHCSGFAVFGKATKDGKLYHGRVLDYMTTIGLQDTATTFIVAVDGKIPFANVGYAGFIGSVSGMNDRAISLGEMGGRGEGKWDGVPMATLMRRALEECSTLDEVMKLWTSSPRTCEYYYVFSDGKTNSAVGVAATPESIEFVQPGEAHPLLGDGIPDTVVLSAGDRLTRLKQRVNERYGQIDAEGAQFLMCRPVAMESNLHNVLFVPADGILYVANASHTQPAAERPYVRIDLKEMLRGEDGNPRSTSASGSK